MEMRCVGLGRLGKSGERERIRAKTGKTKSRYWRPFILSELLCHGYANILYVWRPTAQRTAEKTDNSARPRRFWEVKPQWCSLECHCISTLLDLVHTLWVLWPKLKTRTGDQQMCLGPQRSSLYNFYTFVRCWSAPNLKEWAYSLGLHPPLLPY